VAELEGRLDNAYACVYVTFHCIKRNYRLWWLERRQRACISRLPAPF
jgi:hypothetical protein